MKAPRPAPTFFENATIWIGSPSSVLIHTGVFVFAFLIGISGLAPWDMVLLVLTTIVSLEAIYLAIFIQMSVNRQAKELEEVSDDIDEIQEDIDEIQEDVDEIQEDVEEISEDVEDIQEDVEEMSEDEETAPAATRAPEPVESAPGVDHVLAEVRKILIEIEEIKAQLPKKEEKPKAMPVMKKIANRLSVRKGKAAPKKA